MKEERLRAQTSFINYEWAAELGVWVYWCYYGARPAKVVERTSGSIRVSEPVLPPLAAPGALSPQCRDTRGQHPPSTYSLAGL